MKTSSDQTLNSLSDIQILISNLNESLLELKDSKNEYQAHISECKGLCLEIRKLMDATTARIIKSGESQLSY